MDDLALDAIVTNGAVSGDGSVPPVVGRPCSFEPNQFRGRTPVRTEAPEVDSIGATGRTLHADRLLDVSVNYRTRDFLAFFAEPGFDVVVAVPSARSAAATCSAIDRSRWPR